MLWEVGPWMLLEILEYFRIILTATGEKNAPSDYWAASLLQIAPHKLTYVTYESIIKINKVYLIKNRIIPTAQIHGRIEWYVHNLVRCYILLRKSSVHEHVLEHFCRRVRHDPRKREDKPHRI